MIEYVKKRLDLMDPAKIALVHKQVKLLQEQVTQVKANLQDVKQIGHDKDAVLYTP